MHIVCQRTTLAHLTDRSAGVASIRGLIAPTKVSLHRFALIWCITDSIGHRRQANNGVAERALIQSQSCGQSAAAARKS